MKSKTMIISLMIVSLFIVTLNTDAYAINIDDISYPSKIREGDLLRITVSFDYEYTTIELYGGYIELVYSVTYKSLALPYLPAITEQIAITETKPSSVAITVDTSTLGLDAIDEDVLFTFKIGYDMGQYIASVYTETHAVTIINTNINTTQLLYICSGSAFVGVLLIFLTYYLIKKRK